MGPLKAVVLSEWAVGETRCNANEKYKVRGLVGEALRGDITSLYTNRDPRDQ